MLKDADIEIEPRTVAMLALAVRVSNYSAGSHKLDLQILIILKNLFTLPNFPWLIQYVQNTLWNSGRNESNSYEHISNISAVFLLICVILCTDIGSIVKKHWIPKIEVIFS